MLDGGFHPYFSCFTHFLLVFLAYFSKWIWGLLYLVKKVLVRLKRGYELDFIF